MEDFLYPYNKPVVNGKYDLILDGKIVANEIVFKNLSSQNKHENVNLVDKIKDIESKLQNSFTFETVTELPTEGKESVIYLVPNGDTSGDENSYYEYLWDKTNSKFELIGSGSYEQLMSEIDKRVVINDPITITEGDNTTSITSDTISTTTLTGTLDAESMKNSLTAEAIQNVAPIAWGNNANCHNASSVAIGGWTRANNFGHAFGYAAYAQGGHSLSIGSGSHAKNDCTTALGYYAFTEGPATLTIGMRFTETTDSGNITYTCTTQGTGSITIGAGANTKNPLNPDNKTPYKNSDGEDVESAYSITIGQKAENHSPQNVVIGANAKASNSTQTIDGVEETVLTSNSVTIGYYANNKGADSVVIGASATSTQDSNVIIGAGTNITPGRNLVAIGKNIKNSNKNNCDYSISVGANIIPQSFGVGVGYGTAFKKHAVALGYSSQTHAENTIAIGSVATITNTTNADNTVTTSENTTVIGYGASASAPNSVVLGAGANTTTDATVLIGVNANTAGSGAVCVGVEAKALNAQTIAIGKMSKATGSSSQAIGARSMSAGLQSLVIGNTANATASYAVAIGAAAKAADVGSVVFRSTALDGTYTQLYFSGQNTTLALKYYPTEWEKKQDVDEQGNPKVDDEGNPIMVDDEDKPTKGSAMMGYVVSKEIINDEGKKEIQVVECGTNLLAALFPNHGLGDNPFQPTTTAIDGEEIMSFHPSDLDLLIEEPSENNDMEINVPTFESPVEEEYKPLPLSPIYPIVEPTIEEITN